MQADIFKQTGLRQQGFLMPSLSKQQVIILIVMVLSILYGAYTFFPLLTKKIVRNITGKEEDLNTFITGLNTELSKSYPTITDSYIINRAETEWNRDPFSFRGVPKAVSITGASGKKAVASGTFNYTGFVETGSRKMAIINGFEYGPGDSLEKEGFIVEQIYPTRVVIRNEKKGTTMEVMLKKSGDE